ncbi:hypothetical protein FO519_009636 [Halicephalobus sp. NKZ332]|nr:hypothetical protein FO519_009636 [Halicephalobus sp. NKZ332]
MTTNSNSASTTNPFASMLGTWAQPSRLTSMTGEVDQWLEETKLQIRFFGDALSENQKAILLLSLVDSDIRARLRVSASEPLENLSLRELESLIISTMKPAIPVTLERYTAFTLRQRPLEDLDTWLLRVDKQTSKCDFDKMSPPEIQVLIFTVGLTDERMRKDLLIAMQDKSRSKDLTLATAHTMCKRSLELEAANKAIVTCRKLGFLLSPTPFSADHGGGQPLDFVGETRCVISWNGLAVNGIFYVTENNRLNVLGLELQERLGIRDRIVCCIRPDNLVATIKKVTLPISTEALIGSITAKTVNLDAEEVKKQIAQDPVLKEACRLTTTKWPHRCPSEELKPYFNIRSELCLQLDKDMALQEFLWTQRYTPAAAVPDQKSPAEIFLGRRIRSPLDMLQPRRKEVPRRNERMEHQFNRHHGTRARNFQAGDLVWTRGHPKQPTDAAIVLRGVGEKIYEVQIGTRTTRRHANQIWRRDEPSNQNSPAPPPEDSLTDLWRLWEPRNQDTTPPTRSQAPADDGLPFVTPPATPDQTQMDREQQSGPSPQDIPPQSNQYQEPEVTQTPRVRPTRKRNQAIPFTIPPGNPKSYA